MFQHHNYFQTLKDSVLQYDLMIDKLIIKDINLTASNDDQYFVFEDVLYQVPVLHDSIHRFYYNWSIFRWCCAFQGTRKSSTIFPIKLDSCRLFWKANNSTTTWIIRLFFHQTVSFHSMDSPCMVSIRMTFFALSFLIFISLQLLRFVICSIIPSNSTSFFGLSIYDIGIDCIAFVAIPKES